MGLKLGEDLRRLPKALFGVWQLLLSVLLMAVSVTAQTDPCTTNAAVPTEISFSTSECYFAWSQQSFVVRYTDNATVLSMVVSVTHENRWYSIGFNKNSAMVGGNAMVVWVDPTTGKPQIKQYYMSGKDASQVKIDSRIKFTQAPQAYTTADTIYLAFQIDKVASTGVSLDNQLYAYGSKGSFPDSTTNQFQQHQSMTSKLFNYASGTATNTYSDPTTLRRSHGVISIFGWGILLPVGAIVARYCKLWDPAWFYIHVVMQVMGFVLVTVALIMGNSLGDKVQGVDYGAHQGLGIFVFVLATLQMTALLLRPKKDAKVRRYWNFYHHWAGRAALVLAAVNVFLGIEAAKGGKKWNGSYGLILIIELIVIIVLEILSFVNRSGDDEPGLQLGGNFHSNYNNGAPPSYDN
ncbi:hypothetical protein R1flu_025755 [Riccia fluitans]|uniref:Cytochrome b561 and DOMON domain-containing protein n=1 Tax=Riccia fluitans TaxID=41844 RepID=A0ABD1XYN2_9MARC